MRSKIARRLFTCIITGVVLIALYSVVMLWTFLRPTNARDNANPRKHREMITIIRKVGDLAPIPKGAGNVQVKTEGNIFTRSFRLVYYADSATIRQWLDESDGIQSAKVERHGSTSKYTLKANYGYQYAVVTVDSRKGVVSVYVEGS